MATFHGFKITKLQNWEGHEGLGTAGTLYWNGKKLGSFIDYGDGGCVNFRFPHNKLNEAVAQQLPNLATEIYGADAGWMTPDLDMLVLRLAELTAQERLLRFAWRKANRKGGVVVAINAGDYAYHFTTTRIPTEAEAEDMVKWFVDRHAIRGDYDYKVWDKLPTLDEGAGELVKDKAALAEHKAFREIDRMVKERLAAQA